MRNPAQITKWVLDYRSGDPKALEPKKKGRKRKMDKKKIIRKIENSDCDEQKEQLKQFQEDNLRLRMKKYF